MNAAKRKTAATAAEPDAELLRLNTKYRALMGEIDAGKHCVADGDLRDKATDRRDELERKIADTPAESYAGIGIKLLIGVDNLDPLDPGETRTADLLNLESALADAEHLLARSQEGDAALLALDARIADEYADWKAGKVKDDEAVEYGDRVAEMEQRFAKMPVHTLSGAAAKLRHLRRLLVDDGTLRTHDIPLVETALAAVEQANKAGGAS